MHIKLFYLIFLFLIIFNFSVFATNYTATNCWDYDGDQTGCEANDLCSWDDFGDWCYTRGCWDFGSQTNCNNAANLSCNWKTNNAGGWCEEQGCWSYSTEADCNANPTCEWESTGSWCADRGCWDYTTEATCTEQTDLNITCEWKGSWCEESGACWENWGDQTTCESNPLCVFENNSYTEGADTHSWSSCYKRGCWNYTAEATCTNALTELNLPCNWHSDTGWCESVGCWNFDWTNVTHCEINASRDYNLSCTWDAGSSMCYEQWGCNYHYSEKTCTDTYYCIWADGSCTEPSGVTIEGNYMNPSCWIFNSNWSTCINISGCSFDNTTNTCGGTPASYGISCNNITGRDICNSISILSTCCIWENSICNATFGGKCYDNIKDMPTDSGNEITKCKDATTKQVCDQIANDPWYMPCRWDNMSTSTETDDKCMFNNKDFNMEIDATGGKKLCEMAGGKYVCDCYTNFDGNTQTECMCVIEKGTSTSNCDFNCMSCEYRANGSSWGSSAAASDACTNSEANCEWTTDSNAVSGYGWCTYPTSIQYGYGNCDTDCYSCYTNATCATSVKNCSWELPTSSGWCENTNSASCWNMMTQTTCEEVSGCNWQNNYSYCEQQGCWSYYEETLCNAGEGPTGFSCAWNSEHGYCEEQGCWINTQQADCENVTNNATCQWEGSWCTERGCWNYWDETSCLSINDDLSCSWQGSSEASGWCTDTAMYQAKTCSSLTNLTCQHCMGQTDCENAGCQWNSTFISDTTGIQLDVCILAGNTPEICSNPGDEDYDGYSDCSDPDCLSDPMCGYGFGGDYGGGATGMNASIECWTYDFTNSSICANCNNTCAADSCYWHEVSGSTNWTDINSTWGAGGWVFTDGYLCDPTFEKTMKFGGGMGMQSGAPTEIGTDNLGETKVEDQTWLDIARLGIHDMPDTLDIGISIKNLTDFVGCNKFYQSSLNKTGKYYRYLDTDGNSTGGCKAKDAWGGQLIGFEYMFYYIKNLTGETKGLYKCQSGKWQTSTATISAMDEGCTFTDPFATTSDYSGVQIVLIQKKDIGNPTNDLRIFISTANKTSNESSPLDSAGPFYYTPGSFDFMFEDCMKSGVDMDGDGFTSEQDPDCAMMKTYGYIIKEEGPECSDGVDNDGNGYTDCNDNNCKYNSLYCTTYSFTSPDPNDNTAPQITWYETSSFPDGAFVMYDTNEPTNGTLLFYGRESTCETLNKSIYDTGIIEEFMDSYKTWHDGPVDGYSWNRQRINNTLATNQAYYYKTKVCDPSGNCAISACSNFTTKASTSKLNCPTCQSKFKFDFTPATGVAATDLKGNLSLQGDFTDDDGIYETSMSDDCGCSSATYINYSNLQNFSLKYNNPTAAKNWSLIIKDATSKKGTLSDEISNITSADFTVQDTGTTAGTTVTFVGIEEEKWEKIKTEASIDYIDIQLPGNQEELWHCDDDLENCIDVTGDTGAENLGYNADDGQTTWRISASLYGKVGM